MQNCLGELNLTYTLVYLDDVVVFSKTKEEHLIGLQAVLEQFQAHGLKLKPWKCDVFQKEISYRSDMVNSKWFRGHFFLRIRWKFDLTIYT